MEDKSTLKFDFHFDETMELQVSQLTNDQINTQTQSSNVTELSSLDDLLDEDSDVEIVHDVSNSSAKTWEIKVVTIGNWPEFKTKTCYKWVRIPLDGRTKVPYPCVWRRTCSKSWYLRIVYGGSGSLPGDIEDIIQECSKIALIPAVPILLTGNVGGAVAAFLAAFKQCLIAKGIQQATKFSAGFHTKKTCGKWKRV